MAATLDDVAARAGVGVGTVYRRFPDKEALLAAAFLDLLDRLAHIAEEALARDDGWDGLTFFLRRCSQMQADDRGLRDVALASGYGGVELDLGRDRIVPLVDQLVARAQAEGSLRQDVRGTDIPLLLFMATEVACHGSAVRPDLHTRYLQLLIDGLRAPGDGDLGEPPRHEDLESFRRCLAPPRSRRPSTSETP